MPNIAAFDIESSAPVPPELRERFHEYQHNMAEFNASPCRRAASTIAYGCGGLSVLCFCVAGVGGMVKQNSTVLAFVAMSAFAGCFTSTCAAWIADEPTDPTAPTVESEGP